MTIIKRRDAPRFHDEGISVTAYAAPSRGASQVSMWCLELAPGSTSPLHQMDCEEVFLGVDGRVLVTVDGTEHDIAAGDCLILPAETPFTFRVPGDQPFRALVCMPAGGQATLVPEGTTFPPPWAE
jgi:mannose-6-phosphate isomerase-like protein (cupin superfamily)